MKNLIQENQNANGGGLATGITGLFESNRNALAKMDVEKRTAGEVAQSLRKKGHEIYAKDLKPLMDEWHHAGKLPKHLGGGMAKVYYTAKTDNEILLMLEEQEKEKIAQKELNRKLKRRVCYGYYWVWDSDNYSSYGKRRNFKRTVFYKGNQLDKPQQNFTELSKKNYEALKHHEGEKTFGWDEPYYSV